MRRPCSELCCYAKLCLLWSCNRNQARKRINRRRQRILNCRVSASSVGVTHPEKPSARAGQASATPRPRLQSQTERDHKAGKQVCRQAHEDQGSNAYQRMEAG